MTSKLRRLLWPGVDGARHAGGAAGARTWQVERLHWKRHPGADRALRGGAGDPAAGWIPQPFTKVGDRPVRDDLAALWAPRCATRWPGAARHAAHRPVAARGGATDPGRPRLGAEQARAAARADGRRCDVRAMSARARKPGLFSPKDDAPARQFYHARHSGIGAALGLPRCRAVRPGGDGAGTDGGLARSGATPAAAAEQASVVCDHLVRAGGGLLLIFGLWTERC